MIKRFEVEIEIDDSDDRDVQSFGFINETAVGGAIEDYLEFDATVTVIEKKP